MKKKAACFVAALAIFAQNGVAIAPKLENILEDSHFYMAYITKKSDVQATEEPEVPANAADTQADNAEAVAAPMAAAQPDNAEQVTELEEKLKKEIVYISPALFVNCDALTGHLKRKGQQALSQKFEDYAERLYNRPRANMRLEQILHFELPENDTTTLKVDRHFMVCAQAFHEKLKQDATNWNATGHQNSFDQDRPIFFFTRHLFKGFFDNDTDAFKTAYDHAKAKEAFYRDLQEAQSALSEDPVADMLQKASECFHHALETCKDSARTTLQQNHDRHAVVAFENKMRGINMINPSYDYTVPSLHDHLEAKRIKWQNRREMLSRLCVEHNTPLE